MVRKTLLFRNCFKKEKQPQTDFELSIFGISTHSPKLWKQTDRKTSIYLAHAILKVDQRRSTRNNSQNNNKLVRWTNNVLKIKNLYLTVETK